MFHSNPIVSASLSVALAAGVAGVFTIATDTSAGDRTTVTRPAVSGLVDRSDLRSIYFNAQPMAGRGPLVKVTAPSGKTRGIVSEEIVPERANDMRQRHPIMNGCESGLSPDISPTVPTKARRCLT
jgi:hypothetical protein